MALFALENGKEVKRRIEKLLKHKPLFQKDVSSLDLPFKGQAYPFGTRDGLDGGAVGVGNTVVAREPGVAVLLDVTTLKPKKNKADSTKSLVQQKCFLK